MSVLSTAMSRLNAFLDSELEQVLCFGSAVDAEKFSSQKTALFIVMPEEDPTAYFLVSLIIQQLYRELMTVADEHGGKLPSGWFSLRMSLVPFQSWRERRCSFLLRVPAGSPSWPSFRA